MEFESSPQIIKIEKLLHDAAKNGAFTNLWYFIRDIENISIEFGLEISIVNEDQIYDQQIYPLAELYREGFKTQHGDYLTLKIALAHRKKKYIIHDVSKNEPEPIPGPKLISQVMEYEHIDYALFANSNYQPEKFDMQTIEIDQSPKLNEALLFVIFGDKLLKEFLYQLSCELELILEDREEQREDFDACFYIAAVYMCEQGFSWKDDLVWMIEDGTIDDIYSPPSTKKLQQMIDDLSKDQDLKTIYPSLPKTIIDMLNDVEKLIDKEAPLRTVLREYYTVWEVYLKDLYQKFYPQIQAFEVNTKNEKDREKYNLDKIKEYGEDYRITNLKSAIRLISLLAHDRIDTFDKETKDSLKIDVIQPLELVTSISQLRNLATHVKPSRYLESLLRTAIRSLKFVFKELHTTLNRVN